MRAGYKEERDALHEEAEMPLEQLMAIYGYVVPGARHTHDSIASACMRCAGEGGAAASAAPEAGEQAAPVAVKEEPLDGEAGPIKRPRSPAPPTRVVRPRLAASLPKDEEPAMDVGGLSAGGDEAGPSGSAPPVDEDEASGSSGMEEEEDDEATLDQVGGC